jgi:hypothetical protein
VENIAWQAAHLGMSALARMVSESVWKDDYLLERPQDGTV